MNDDLTQLVAATEDLDTRARAALVFGPEAAGLYDDDDHDQEDHDQDAA